MMFHIGSHQYSWITSLPLCYDGFELYQNVHAHFQENKSSVVKLVLLVTGIITASLAIAVIPLIPSMEEYFVQGMYYDPSYKVFIGFPNKEKHVRILQSHYNTTSTAEALKNNISMDMTWKEIGDQIQPAIWNVE